MDFLIIPVWPSINIISVTSFLFNLCLVCSSTLGGEFLAIVLGEETGIILKGLACFPFEGS